MVLYAIIMFLAAVPMGWVSIAIYRGNTSLIHDYHQTKVSDKVAYGKAFGKAMLIISAALLLSGVVSLLDDTETMAMISLAVLFAGLIVGIACIVAVQIKYNKGVF